MLMFTTGNCKNQLNKIERKGIQSITFLSSTGKEIEFFSCLIYCFSWFDFLFRAFTFNIKNAAWSVFFLLLLLFFVAFFCFLFCLKYLIFQFRTNSSLHVAFWLNIGNHPIHDHSFIRLTQFICTFCRFM